MVALELPTPLIMAVLKTKPKCQELDSICKQWKRRLMDKRTLEHISKIIVHPSDSNTVWVAAQGPLWSSWEKQIHFSI